MKKKNNQKETRFKSWKIDGYTAKSPCGKYELWIANGFMCFDDIGCHYPKKPLLFKINVFQKYKIWRELVKEIKLRASNFLNKK